MKLIKSFILFVLLIVSVGCSSEGKNKSLISSVAGNLNEFVNSELNAIEQAKPVIMILPSDKTLRDLGCLKVVNNGGKENIIRNFQKFVVVDDDARPIISTIQEAFIESEFPLNDFEQSIKQINTQDALDNVSGYAKDAKTILLSTLRPDIVVELSYDKGANSLVRAHSYNVNNSRNNKKINYTLTAYDAYTNKVVATINQHDLQGSSRIDAIKTSLNEELPNFKNSLLKYFNDIVTRGREVTMRVTVAKGSNVKLSDESIEGDTYADWIIDYVKVHTVKGAYKMQTNTQNELYFVNCRIKYFNEDGTQYGVYDWSRDMIKNLRRNLGLKCSNQTQGLGEVVLTIEGLR